MSIFGTIASDLGNVFSDPGKLVTDLVDAVLPDKLRSVGDAAGGVVDALLGKESQALTHFEDGLRDFSELIGDTGQTGDLTPSNQTLPSKLPALQSIPALWAQSIRA